MKKLISLILSLALILSPYAAEADLQTSLVSCWALDEASGTAVDAFGDRDLTDGNTVGATTGKVNGARDFELDNTEYFEHADHADLSLGADTDFTWVTWVKAEDLPGYNMPLIHKGSDYGEAVANAYAVWVSNVDNKLRFYVSNGSTGAGVSWSAVLSTATWYFVAVWHDSAADKIYIQVDNGTAVEAAWSGGTQNDTNAFNLGGWNASAVKFDGILDETAFWKRTLTADERTELYNSGNGKACPFTAAAAAAAPTARILGDVKLNGTAIIR